MRQLIKAKRSYEEIERERQERIKRIDGEIANLWVILKALPADQEGAINIIADQIEALQKKLPKHRGRIWWHWLIEYCPKCQSQASQQPFSEDLGEDCALFGAMDQYHNDQEDGTTDYKCSCGGRLVMRYRHATADMTEDQKREALKYAEYQLCKA